MEVKLKRKPLNLPPTWVVGFWDWKGVKKDPLKQRVRCVLFWIQLKKRIPKSSYCSFLIRKGGELIKRSQRTHILRGFWSIVHCFGLIFKLT